jgi:hypothetical protein
MCLPTMRNRSKRRPETLSGWYAARDAAPRIFRQETVV